MSTATVQAIEFRCNRCWQSILAELSAAGGSTTCLHCQAEVPVPEATPDRIREVDEIASAEAAAEPEVTPQPMTNSQWLQVTNEETGLPINERDFCGYPNASSLTRLLAQFIDACVIMGAFALGLVAAIAADHLGLMAVASSSPAESGFNLLGLLLMYFFPLVAIIVQWNLITTRGQTIGKFLTAIRIVTINGRVPGFVGGVILRNWLRNLLGLIPFFSLVDILFIFSDSKRCLHDYLAGTRVIQG